MRERVMALVVLALAGVFWALPSGGAWQMPIRLATAWAVVLVLPGLGLLRALRLFAPFAGPVERLVFAGAAGYAAVAVLSMIAPALGLSANVALLPLAALALLLLLPAAEEAPEPGLPGWACASLLAGVVAVLLHVWIVEAPILGEETAELITIRKIASAERITFDGVLHRPNAVPTYLFTPYYLLVALVSKAAGVGFIAVYVKSRAVLVLWALGAFWVLARHVLRSPTRAGVALAVVLVLALIDPDPCGWPASLLPLCRRGSFAAGVLMPVLMAAGLRYTLHGGAAPRATLAACAVLLFGLITTHALEAVHLCFWVFAVVVAAWVAGEKDARTRAGWLAAAVLLTMAGYKAMHGFAVTHVAAYEAGRKAEIVERLMAMLRDGRWLSVPDDGAYLVGGAGAAVPWSIFPLLLLPLLARRDALLWAAAALPLLLFTTPILLVCQVAVTPEVHLVSSYLTLVGVLIAVECAFRAPRWAVLAALPAAWLAMTASVRWPGLPLAFAGAAVVAMWRRHAPEEGRPAWALVMLVVVAVGMKFFPARIDGSTRADAYTQARAAWKRPGVARWAEYYPHMCARTCPPLDVPLHVVRDLEKILSVGCVCIHDPAHSYALPTVLDVFIVNPGHLLSTDMEYHERFVRRNQDGSADHPIFGRSTMMDERDWEMLARLGVEFVVVNPGHAASVRAKFAAHPDAFAPVYERDGFLVYKVAARPSLARR